MAIRTELEAVITARGLAIVRHKPKCREGGILNTMCNKSDAIEALNICDLIRDRLMKEDRPLSERIREDKALAQVMDLAQSAIENPCGEQKPTSLDMFKEELAKFRRENNT